MLPDYQPTNPFALPDFPLSRLRVKASAYEARLAELRWEYAQCTTDAQRAAALDSIDRVTANYNRTYPGRPIALLDHVPAPPPIPLRKSPNPTRKIK